jgi:hypothetical protein
MYRTGQHTTYQELREVGSQSKVQMEKTPLQGTGKLWSMGAEGPCSGLLEDELAVVAGAGCRGGLAPLSNSVFDGPSFFKQAIDMSSLPQVQPLFKTDFVVGGTVWFL